MSDGVTAFPAIIRSTTTAVDLHHLDDHSRFDFRTHVKVMINAVDADSGWLVRINARRRNIYRTDDNLVTTGASKQDLFVGLSRTTRGKARVGQRELELEIDR